MSYRNQLIVYSLFFYFFPLICLFIQLPIPYCIDFCSLIVKVEVHCELPYTFQNELIKFSKNLLKFCLEGHFKLKSLYFNNIVFYSISMVHLYIYLCLFKVLRISVVSVNRYCAYFVRIIMYFMFLDAAVKDRLFKFRLLIVKNVAIHLIFIYFYCIP